MIARCSTVRVGAAALWMATAGAANAQDFSILHYERLTVTSNDAAAAGGSFKPEDRGTRLHFVAFGRRFDLELEPNDALVSALPAEQMAALADVELYRGQLVGVPGSWVRLARHRGALSGMIWDGAELYSIDDYERVAPVLLAPESARSTGPVIYRWSETVGTLADAVDDLIGSKPSEAAGPALGPVAFATGVRPGKQLDVGLIADAEYAAREGSATPATLLSALNIVDGIFIKHVGIRVNAAAIKIFETEADPFSAFDGSALLDELENYKDATPEMRTLGAAQLFTGRDLTDPPGTTGQRIGVANLGHVCSPRLATGVAQATFGAGMNAVIFAHELGHILGAPHDNAPGMCASVAPQYVMAPTINGSHEFSSCSVQQMLPAITSAACLRDLPPADVSLRLTTAPGSVFVPSEMAVVRMSISNSGSAQAVGLELTADAPNFGNPSMWFGGGSDSSCFYKPFRCVWPYLGPNQVVNAEIAFPALHAGVGAIDIAVSALNESSPADRLHFDVEVLPPVDLATTVEPAELPLHPGETATVHATITNVGAVHATSVKAWMTMRNTTELVDSGLGACTFNGSSWTPSYECAIGDLSPGAMKRFDVVIRAKPGLRKEQIDEVGGSLDVGATARQPDSNATNSYATTRLTLGTSIADLAVTLAGSTQLTVAQRFQLELKIRNNGPDTAEEIEIQHQAIGVPLAPALSEITTAQGACTMQAPANEFRCSVPQLASGQELTIRLAGTPTNEGVYSFGAQTRMRGTDRNRNNDGAYLSLRASLSAPPVSEPPAAAQTQAAVPASGGGGGGSADFALLLALALGTWLRGVRLGVRHCA